MINTNKELRDALLSLGWSADQVADTLRTRGVVGRQQTPYRCAVARGLGFDGYPRGVCETWASIGKGMVRLPPPVREFVERFDRGEYPDLIEDHR